MAFAVRKGRPRVTGDPDDVNPDVRLLRRLDMHGGSGQGERAMTTSALTRMPILGASIIFVVILILPL
jgi:hypothetical protein